MAASIADLSPDARQIALRNDGKSIKSGENWVPTGMALLTRATEPSALVNDEKGQGGSRWQHQS